MGSRPMQRLASRSMHRLLALDHRVARAASTHPLPAPLAPAVRAVSHLGLFPLHVALWALAAVSVGGARSVALALGGAVVVRAACFALKAATRRARPFEAVAGVARRGARPPDASFPSSHTAQAVYSAVALARVAAPAGVPFVPPWPVLAVLAAAVAYARLRLGVHFLSDVVVGAALGAVAAVAVAALA